MGVLVFSMELQRRPLTFWCFFFFFFFVVVVVVPQSTLAASPYLGSPYLNCLHNTTNGTSLTSTFKHNLNTALQNLTSLSSQGTKYAITSAGSGDDMVYAMFQCRGDQTTPLCSECVANATVRLPQSDCPTSIGARIQLDGCYFRYDNTSFFTPNFSYVIGYCYAKSSDPVALAAISSLVQNVTTQAPEQGGFASGSAAGEYAAAQCLGYLNKSECAECLSSVPYRTLCDSTLGEQVHLTSCYYRFEPYSFLEALAPAPAPSSVPGQPSPRRGLIRILCGVFGAVFGVTALCVVLLWRYKRAKERQEEVAVDGWAVMTPRAAVFSLQELEAATQHFHPLNKLGEGGYGPVYKGTLANGQVIAIKRLSPRSHQGKKEFLNEVNLITSVQHKNLVKLFGSCVTRGERMLVYEYLPNRSLDVVLFEKEAGTLDWPVRYGIVLGIARGLAYLHEESQVRIIHRDIKPSNILLDDKLNPIIADFGLARLVCEEESAINTKIAGTLGYLAPEYAIHGEFTMKVDVFSFGVVTLEVVSGKRNSNIRLLEWAWKLFLQGQHLELVDPRLGDAFSADQARNMIHVALLCTQGIPRLRPTMSRVVLWLSEQLDIIEVPTKPAFVEVDESEVFAHPVRNTLSSSSGHHGSTRHVSNAPHTITELQPR